MSCLVQWSPVAAARHVLFFVRAGAEHEVAAIAATEPHVSTATAATEVFLPGVNLDGGSVDLGDAGPDIVTVSGSSSQAILDAVDLLCGHVEPAAFLFPGGPAVHVDDRVEVYDPPGTWAGYLTDVCTVDRAYEALLVGASSLAQVHFGSEIEEWVLDGARAAARLCPDRFDAHAHCARLLNALGHHVEATEHAERAVATATRDHLRAEAFTAIGYARHALGDYAGSVAAYRSAYECGKRPDRSRALGIALMRVGELDEALNYLELPAWTTRNLVAVAAGLASADRSGLAADLLEITRPTVRRG